MSATLPGAPSLKVVYYVYTAVRHRPNLPSPDIVAFVSPNYHGMSELAPSLTLSSLAQDAPYRTRPTVHIIMPRLFEILLIATLTPVSSLPNIPHELTN